MGCVGTEDGEVRIEELSRNGINTSLIHCIDCRTGHAIIQVNEAGQNSILLYGGANRTVTVGQINETLFCFSTGDLFVMQNEISNLPYLPEATYEQGLVIAFNPHPMHKNRMDCFCIKDKFF